MKLFPILCFTMLMSGQPSASQLNAKIEVEDQLRARLRWEIIWWDLLQGKEIPEPSIEVQITRTENNISYCSQTINVCATYNWKQNQLGERIRHQYTSASDGGDNVPAPAVDPLRVSAQGFGGLSKSASLSWSVTLRTGTRAEIINQYKTTHSPSLSEFTSWLRMHLKDATYKKVTVACFAQIDPYIYVSAEGPAGSTIISYFWESDEDFKTWVVASLLYSDRDKPTYEEMRTIVESIPCSTINF